MKQPNLNILQSIMFMELRPWLNQSITEAKFKQMLVEVKSQVYSFQPLYEVSFPKPLNAKRKYYYELIENEIIQYLNAVNIEISSSLNDSERKYWVHTMLHKTLTQKLKEISSVMESQDWDALNSQNKAVAPQT